MSFILLRRVILLLLLAAAAPAISSLYGQAPLPRAGNGRQIIKAKLANIRLDTFAVDRLPLSEVLKNLSDESRKRDPERRGINFLVDPNGDTATVATNQPAVATPVEPVNISGLQIKISALDDISLEEALKAIIKVAGPPRLKYQIEDYAVVFYPSGETIPLAVRVFKVDPNTFQQGLQSVVGVPFATVRVTAGTGGGGAAGGGAQGSQNPAQVSIPRAQVAPTPQGGILGVTRTNTMDTVQASVRSFLQSLGVDMTPPKSAFFNDRQGTLIVRATPADLEIIEAALGR